MNAIYVLRRHDTVEMSQQSLHKPNGNTRALPSLTRLFIRDPENFTGSHGSRFRRKELSESLQPSRWQDRTNLPIF